MPRQQSYRQASEAMHLYAVWRVGEAALWALSTLLVRLQHDRQPSGADTDGRCRDSS